MGLSRSRFPISTDEAYRRGKAILLIFLTFHHTSLSIQISIGDDLLKRLAHNAFHKQTAPFTFSLLISCLGGVEHIEESLREQATVLKNLFLSISQRKVLNELSSHQLEERFCATRLDHGFTSRLLHLAVYPGRPRAGDESHSILRSEDPKAL